MPRQKTPDAFTRQRRALFQRHGVKLGGRLLGRVLTHAMVDEKMVEIWKKRRPKTLGKLVDVVQGQLGLQKEGRWKGHYYDVDTIRPLVIHWLRRLPLTEQPHFLMDLHQPHVQLATTRHVAWLRQYVREMKAYLKELQRLPDPPQRLCQDIQILIEKAQNEPPNPFESLKRRSSPAK